MLTRLTAIAAHLAPRRTSPYTSSLARRHLATMSSSIPKTMKALQIHQQGGPEVLQIHDVPVPQPGPSEVLLKVEWAGVNYIDTYFRSGVYPIELPKILGQEPAGEIVALGKDVAQSGVSIGEKVASYANGAYAEYVAVPRSKVVKLPQGVDTRTAAAAVLQGLTAWTLLRESYPVKRGDWILVHAAAGGVGLMLCQMAKHLGAHVIGTTSTEEKAKLAKENGAEHIILYAQGESVVDKTLELTNGEGVQAVYDGVGKDTWEDDFKIIARKGTIVTFGNASGPVPAFAPLKLSPKNVKVCRPTLGNYVYTQSEMESYSSELFDLLARGIVKLRVHGEYEFSEEGIKKTQMDITGRGTTGKLIVKVAA